MWGHDAFQSMKIIVRLIGNVSGLLEHPLYTSHHRNHQNQPTTTQENQPTTTKIKPTATHTHNKTQNQWPTMARPMNTTAQTHTHSMTWNWWLTIHTTWPRRRWPTTPTPMTWPTTPTWQKKRPSHSREKIEKKERKFEKKKKKEFEWKIWEEREKVLRKEKRKKMKE